MRHFRALFFTTVLGTAIGVFIIGIALTYNVHAHHKLRLGLAGPMVLAIEVIYWAIVLAVVAANRLVD